MTEKDKNLIVQEEGFKSVLILGDIQVASASSNLNDLTTVAESCLKNKKISKYLNYSFPKKKMLGI
jgi:hypothetical protein